MAIVVFSSGQAVFLQQIPGNSLQWNTSTQSYLNLIHYVPPDKATNYSFYLPRQHKDFMLLELENKTWGSEQETLPFVCKHA